MKAMILAAGLGTRLRPLTEGKPKALMPVVNKPIISRVVDYLKGHGVDQIIVNAHHHQRQLVDYLTSDQSFGMEIQVRVEKEILGTGGGIKNVADFWDAEPFIVINSDVLTNIDLHQAYKHHRESGAIVTLILHDCEPFNQILLDNDHNIVDIDQSNDAGRLAFMGIHIMSSEILAFLPGGTYSNIIDCYRHMIHAGSPVKAYVSQSHYWHDIGTIESYVDANKDLLENAFAMAPCCHVDPSVKLHDWVIIGTMCQLEKNVEVTRSILWDGVNLKEGVRIIDSIVTSSRVVTGDLVGEVY